VEEGVVRSQVVEEEYFPVQDWRISLQERTSTDQTVFQKHLLRECKDLVLELDLSSVRQ
jgi:hypothetical protein